MTPTRSIDQRIVHEQKHRRWLLVGIAALLVASTTPVFGHHILPATVHWPIVDHLGAFCLRAIETLFAPVHDGFHLIILAGLAYAVFDRVRAIRTLQAVVLGLHATTPRSSGILWRAARRAGLNADSIRVVRALPNPAFTAGLVRPRVYVAAELERQLPFDQLVALLAHERAHVDRRDPLRLSVFRALACTLFWLPALRRLSDDLADESEIVADNSAAAQAGAIALAAALVALATWPATRVPASAGFAHPDLLERRVRRLLGEDTPAGTHLTWRSLFGAALALALLWTSGAVALHERTRADLAAEAHCSQHGGSPLSHLFCLKSGTRAPGEHCPHATG